jgi:membrane protease YdiL (CAAX protease family)
MIEPSEPRQVPRNPWSILDLVMFGVFFGLTVIFLPLGMIQMMRIFRPDLQITDLTAVDHVLLQGAMNLVLLAFIVFLVKVVHGQSFRHAIHWFRNHDFKAGFLIAMGAGLAITVLIVSSFFPPSEPPPIEKLLMSSTTAIYVFAIFGVGIAPLFEEIIFRGFLFKVLAELGGPAVAVPMTAVLFALPHIPQLWGSWSAILVIFFVGYVLSAVRQRSNSVIPSFIIHTAYNAMLFALFALNALFVKNPVSGN